MGSTPFENEVPTRSERAQSTLRRAVVGGNLRGSVRDTVLAIVVVICLVIAAAGLNVGLSLAAGMVGIVAVMLQEAGR